MPSACLNLNQQLVIVTGASRGLGAAIAPERALAVQADVRDPEP